VSWGLEFAACAGRGILLAYSPQAIVLYTSSFHGGKQVNGNSGGFFDQPNAIPGVFQIAQLLPDVGNGVKQPFFTPSKVSSMDRLCAVFDPEVVGSSDVPMISVVLQLDLPQVPELVVLGEEIVVFRSETVSQVSRIRFRRVNFRELNSVEYQRIARETEKTHLEQINMWTARCIPKVMDRSNCAHCITAQVVTRGWHSIVWVRQRHQRRQQILT
jgi:hypothetical protein